MPEVPDHHVPEGAAVFPTIPAELGIHPLLLAVLHATVFLAGSDDEIVSPEAAGEAVEAMADYVQRMAGPGLNRIRADLDRLVVFARGQKWPQEEIDFLQNFLSDFGVGE